ncbi:leucine-rich repeat domain-containing protein [Blastopirellula marina]|uniref:Leucine Rich repeats (2 copies) n=1 Tax=Blastopirellula marina TaxID=124 RepID=A0A2S8GE64_9BACT|nr:hypothetical protein [Blastopirellula marina]PQO42752.1 hypothetical protein C5Y98_00950 [Blastopirellula marina]PTL46518.1 hypothetical protein C5Y97_00950 [Blastopirellula marina]
MSLLHFKFRALIAGVVLLCSLGNVARLLADDRDYESPEIRRAVQLLQKNGAHVDFYENYEEQTSYYVNLYGTRANDENLQALLALPRVERLWLGANFELSPRTWNVLSQLSELQHLHVFGKATDNDLMQIARFSNLISLQLDGNQFSPVGLWYLEELTQLEQLSIKVDGDAAEYFSYLARLPKLSQLSIYDANAKNVSLKGIENLHEIQTLSISFGNIPGSTLQSLAGLTKLKTLTLSNATFQSADMDVFRKLKGLEHLNLHHCEFPADNLDAFEGLENVQHLAISHSNLIDAAMLPLSKLKSLNYLYLHLTPITDKGLKNLRDAQRLETLHLRNTEVTQAGVDWLSEKLPNLRVIAPLSN